MQELRGLWQRRVRDVVGLVDLGGPVLLAQQPRR